MNANAVAKHYGSLTPQERFRLILAASGRGDEAERDRLGRSGQRITRSMQDHAPHAHAFNELALMTFIELLEEAARYGEAFANSADAFGPGGDESEYELEGDDTEHTYNEHAAEAQAENEEWTVGERWLDLALAAGFVLRTKAEGWKRFCERMNVPPFLLWERLPGFDRLRRALAQAERASFVPEGFLRWLNDTRPAGKPELTEIPLSVEAVAYANAEMFGEHVAWWGG